MALSRVTIHDVTSHNITLPFVVLRQSGQHKKSAAAKTVGRLMLGKLHFCKHKRVRLGGCARVRLVLIVATDVGHQHPSPPLLKLACTPAAQNS